MKTFTWLKTKKNILSSYADVGVKGEIAATDIILRMGRTDPGWFHGVLFPE